jgi:hypothetical protein
VVQRPRSHDGSAWCELEMLLPGAMASISNWGRPWAAGEPVGRTERQGTTSDAWRTLLNTAGLIVSYP